jgi:hypothetical protein
MSKNPEADKIVAEMVATANERRTEIVRVNVATNVEEERYVAVTDDVTYVRTSRPIYKFDGPMPMNERQRDNMTLLCRTESAMPTGYDYRPSEALREDPSIHKLLDMLETCRPGGSVEEEAFIQTYLMPHDPYVDGYGNHIITVDGPEAYPNILWSCHTDTVHRHGGAQKVEVTSGVAWTSDGSCLGSDDTVGIWLALEMIVAKVPGTYVFHREEESGGGGSLWLAANGSDYIGQFDAAIALDRAGYADVITYQGGQRCCSDEFARSVAALLGGRFKPCDGGVFTDTANYVDLIGECTNLSVGYFKQHGPMEHTNLSFAANLRDALIAADWTKLVLKRQPGEVEETDRWGWFDNSRSYGQLPKRDRGAPAYGGQAEAIDDMEKFVSEYPWVVAQYLVELGVSIDDLDLYEPGDATIGGKEW